MISYSYIEMMPVHLRGIEQIAWFQAIFQACHADSGQKQKYGLLTLTMHAHCMAVTMHFPYSYVLHQMKDHRRLYK